MTTVTYASTTRHDEWKGKKRYVSIVIHKTEEELRQACARYSHYDNGHWASAVGAFHPSSHREKYDRKTKKWIDLGHPNFAGVIRLCRPWVNSDVIVHEVVHAAAHIFRMDIAKRVNLGDNCHRSEEDFAYIVGDLSHSVMSALKKTDVPLLY